MTNPNRISLRIGLVFLSLALLWVLFSIHIVPPLIERAYHGESVEVFNNLISAQATHSVGEYFTSWERVHWLVLKFVLLCGLGFLLINRPEVAQFLATHLSTYRIMLFWAIFLFLVTAGTMWDIPDHWQKVPGWEPEWIAHSLENGEGFSFSAKHRWLFTNQPDSDEYFPTAWYPPVYPVFMAVFFYVFGEDGRLPILVFQILFLTCTAIVLFFLGRMAFNRWTGILAGSILMILPQAQAQAVNSVTTAPIGGLLVSLSACMILWCLQDLSVRRGTILGLVLGFTWLTHGATLLFLPVTVLGIFLLVRPITPGVWKTALAIVVACGIIVGPWTVRNLLVFDELVPVRTGAGYSMYLANPILAETFLSDYAACSNPPTKNAKDALEATLQTKERPVRYAQYKRASECMNENAPEGYDEFNEARRDKVYMKKAWDFIFSEPLAFFNMTSQKSLAFFLADWPMHLQIISLLALLSTLFMIRNQQARVLVLLTLAYTVPYSLGLPCFYRYRYPLEPILLLLASSVVIFSGQQLNGLFRGKFVGAPEDLKG